MTQRQKLELQVNNPVEIELVYDDPVTGENQYGEYFLYAVKTSDGSEYAFFPPREVHEALKDLRAGDKALVTKIAAQRGSRIVSKYDVSVNGKSATKVDSADKKEASSSKEVITGDNYYNAMLQSLKDGLNLSEEINGLSLDHIIRISLSLFIQRTKNGNGHNSNGFNH